MIKTEFRGRIRTINEIAEISGLLADSIRSRYRNNKRGEDLVLDLRATMKYLPVFNKHHPELVAREKASVARRARESAKREALKAQIRELV